MNTLENNFIFRFYPDCAENGSTFTGWLDLGFDVRVHKKIKLVNVKCHSINVDVGMASKKFVEDLMRGKEIFCKTFKDRFRKWSAILAILYIKNGNDCINLNDELVKREFAYSIKDGNDNGNSWNGKEADRDSSD